MAIENRIETIIREIKALSSEQKIELSRRLNEEFVLDEGQSWYWSKEWQAAEKEADEDIATGRVTKFDNIDDALEFLHKQAEQPNEK